MKNEILAATIFLMSTHGLASEAESISELKNAMTNSDAQAREAGMQQFVNGFNIDAQRSEGNEVIPVFVDGLSDTDAKVRQFAATGLLKIAYITMPATHTVSAGANLLGYQSARKAIAKATSDSDLLVRQIALEIYALTYKLTPDMADKAIAEFNAPELATAAQPSNKAALLETLMVGGPPSPHATEFLTKLLDDPKYGAHIAERIAADKCPLPGVALNKLATKLAQEKDPVRRAAFARAIGTYGKQAQQYTPQLQAVLANEKDEVAKVNIRSAIDKINQ